MVHEEDEKKLEVLWENKYNCRSVKQGGVKRIRDSLLLYENKNMIKL